MEAVEAGIVAAVGGGELTVDRVRAEVRALSEGIAAKQVCVGGIHVCIRSRVRWECGPVDRSMMTRHTGRP